MPARRGARNTHEWKGYRSQVYVPVWRLTGAQGPPVASSSQAVASSRMKSHRPGDAPFAAPALAPKKIEILNVRENGTRVA